MPIYSWKNTSTEEVRTWTSTVADRNKFLDTVDDPDLWQRVPEALASRTRLSASYVDGVVPSGRREAVARTREKLAVEIDSYNIRPEKRGDHKKEIKKLENS